MTAPPYRVLGSHRRRGLLARSLLRSAASATVLVAVYYLAPLDRPGGDDAAVTLGLGLVAFGGLIGWQVRAIATAPYPRLRAVEALAMGLPLLLVVFAGTYVLMERGWPGAFSEPLNHTDALYFAVTVFSTVGFGDIVPVSEPARIVTSVQMLIDLVAVGAIARVIFSAVRMGLRRPPAADPPQVADSE